MRNFFKTEEKNISFQKYPQTCGWDLSCRVYAIRREIERLGISVLVLFSKRKKTGL